jgi:hypothetical protein
MAGRVTCPDCGVELMGPRGYCLRCLLQAGLDGDSLTVGAGGAAGATTAPPGSAAVATGAGVLAALATSVGSVPQVLLRDTDSVTEPPARPGSDAMPDARPAVPIPVRMDRGADPSGPTTR